MQVAALPAALGSLTLSRDSPLWYRLSSPGSIPAAPDPSAHTGRMLFWRPGLS